MDRADQCRHVIEPPKIHRGRIYLYDRRYCKRRATIHGRCWQHHGHGWFCQQCADEAKGDPGR